MKKNLMTVIILALVVANFVMTAIMMFTVLPSTNKANEMITKVCEAIDLELNSGAASGLSNLPISQTAAYSVAAGESMTVTLSDGHYLVVGVSISVNIESDIYEESATDTLTAQDAFIIDAIDTILSQYTKEELNANRDQAKNEILTTLKKNFGTDYVVGISFTKFTMD